MLLNKKLCWTALLFIILICIIITTIQYKYYHKYSIIDLSNKENIMRNLKNDIELMNRVKEDLSMMEKDSIRIKPKGKYGYREYHSEEFRKLFQKYGLHWISFIKNNEDVVRCLIQGKYNKSTTYSGFYYSVDGEPIGYDSEEGGPELQKSGQGYQQVRASYYNYYTEYVEGNWYYYETVLYRGLVL